VTETHNELALFGGKPIVDGPIPPYRSVGAEETEAVVAVMRSGDLSGFYGSWPDKFYGGPVVRQFEAAWCATFGCKHAVSVNSNTSGLVAAMGAIGIGPGDEVIVPPYTMSATAVAPLAYGGIPVFADIEPDTFCIDPAAVEAAITPKTKAVVAVNLFGHPARLHELRALADRHGLILVEDNAQAPLAKENGRFTGTIGHIGVFSLNYHKHIHTGEGGLCVTDDDDLALRMALIRNHGENATAALKIDGLANLFGFNLRLTEIGAAIGCAQLAKAERLVADRVGQAEILTQAIAGLPGITPPAVRDDCRHVYYLWSSRYDAAAVGVSRAAFAKALAAEGVPVGEGYVAPLYRLPLFRQRIAMGAEGFPFSLSQQTYRDGMCPVTERMHEHELLSYEVCTHDPSPDQLDQIAAAFHKVYAQRDKLRRLDDA